MLIVTEILSQSVNFNKLFHSISNLHLVDVQILLKLRESRD
jgi:hypothetical protein